MSNFYWEGPMSTAPPTKADSELNERLEALLKLNNFFESEEESAKREIVLGKLDSIVKEWIRKVSLKKNFSDSMANEAGGKIFTLGSYRLGVHQQGADIDTLVLGPKHIDRNDFFQDLYQMLLERPEVTKLTPVPDAHTPIMQMVFSGIEIDLLQATLELSSIPEDIDLNDISILRGLDQKSIRSLNGPRVADELLHLVPNIPAYRLALCAIKLWAQRRGIYSNKMGFLGGISWALMTARICQLYPNACSATIVIKFFMIFKEWKWPNPVTLKPIEEGTLNLPVWNPKLNPAERRQLMPVITPAYPSMNSTYNVSLSTFLAMKEDIARGAEITQRIEKGQTAWDELFEKSDFFSRYKFFLEVTVGAESDEDLALWRGFVESRIRILIMSLEQTPLIKSATPFPDSFVHPVQQTETELLSTEGAPVNEKHSASFFMGLVIEKPSTNLSQAPRSVDLSLAVEHFTKLLLTYERYTPTMTIDIKHMKRSDLPSYVIDPNIKKRAKTSPEKQKKRKNEEQLLPNAKRPLSEGQGSPSAAPSTPPQSAALPKDKVVPLAAAPAAAAVAALAGTDSTKPSAMELSYDHLPELSGMPLEAPVVSTAPKKLDIKISLTSS